MTGSLHIRPASLRQGDDTRILNYLDSHLSWLESVGSAGQWGTDPYSDNPKSQNKYRELVRESEQGFNQKWTTESIQVYVAETIQDPSTLSDDLKQLSRHSEDGELYLPVAIMVLRGNYSEWKDSVGVLKAYDDNDPFICVSYLITDRRVHPYSAGAGAELLEHAKALGRELGIRRLCLDTWRGNGNKLVG
jgi:hypothetical protein